jgi:hypothetical protein
LITGIKTNEVEVFTLKGESAKDDFLEAGENMDDKDSLGVSIRWAVVA